MVNLNRNPAYTDHNIPLDPTHFYRGVIVDGYDDLWSKEPDGRQVMKGQGKGGTDNLSFQAGYPNDLYVNGLVKANTLIVGDESLPVSRQEAVSGYSYVPELDREKVESGETPLRVYQRQEQDGIPIHEVHEWELIFDSFKRDEPKP